MRLPSVRFTARCIIFLAVAPTAMSAVLLVAPLSGRAQAPQSAPAPRMTLLGALAEWKYPDSKMLGGATMSDGGNPAVADVKCQAVLTTPDSFEKVVMFYSEKLESPRGADGPNTRANEKQSEAKAVSSQDDSDGRPVSLRVIVVSKADSTTTLVISRAKSEKETHIAWTHYRWFPDR